MCCHHHLTFDTISISILKQWFSIIFYFFLQFHNRFFFSYFLSFSNRVSGRSNNNVAECSTKSTNQIFFLKIFVEFHNFNFGFLVVMMDKKANDDGWWHTKKAFQWHWIKKYRNCNRPHQDGMFYVMILSKLHKKT